jgi:hypothetical protein
MGSRILDESAESKGQVVSRPLGPSARRFSVDEWALAISIRPVRQLRSRVCLGAAEGGNLFVAHASLSDRTFSRPKIQIAELPNEMAKRMGEKRGLV